MQKFGKETTLYFYFFRHHYCMTHPPTQTHFFLCGSLLHYFFTFAKYVNIHVFSYPIWGFSLSILLCINLKIQVLYDKYYNWWLSSNKITFKMHVPKCSVQGIAPLIAHSGLEDNSIHIYIYMIHIDSYICTQHCFLLHEF